MTRTQPALSSITMSVVRLFQWLVCRRSDQAPRATDEWMVGCIVGQRPSLPPGLLLDARAPALLYQALFGCCEI